MQTYQTSPLLRGEAGEDQTPSLPYERRIERSVDRLPEGLQLVGQRCE